MQTYSLGPCTVDEYDLEHIDQENFLWFVYFYETAPYEGSGFGMALDKNGALWYKGMGHCSCYGPLENGYSGQELGFTQSILVEDFLGLDKDSVLAGFAANDKHYEPVAAKVTQLLGLRPK